MAQGPAADLRYEPVVYTTASPGERLETACLLPSAESTDRSPLSVTPFLTIANRWRTMPRTYCLLTALKMNSALKDGAILRCDRSFRSDSTVLLAHRSSLSPPPDDLQPDLAQLFSNLHRDSVQRKIRRAERKGLHMWLGRQNRCSIRFMD